MSTARPAPRRSFRFRTEGRWQSLVPSRHDGEGYASGDLRPVSDLGSFETRQHRAALVGHDNTNDQRAAYPIGILNLRGALTERAYVCDKCRVAASRCFARDPPKTSGSDQITVVALPDVGRTAAVIPPEI
jgi:hypothetical protein